MELAEKTDFPLQVNNTKLNEKRIQLPRLFFPF